MMRGDADPVVAPARHDLLIVSPADWPAVAGTLSGELALPSDGADLIRGWGKAGRPVIVRRPLPGDAPDALPVGLPLPPRFGKARVGLAIPAGVPWRPIPPVALADTASAVPPPWRDTVTDILRIAHSLALRPRVFGALLWQVVTGLPYVQQTSDLDLLWPVDDADTLGRLLDGLEHVAAAAPMPIDGEILAPIGAVQWRELAGARRVSNGIVLVKSLHRAGFVSADEVLSRQAALCG